MTGRIQVQKVLGGGIFGRGSGACDPETSVGTAGEFARTVNEDVQRLVGSVRRAAVNAIIFDRPKNATRIREELSDVCAAVAGVGYHVPDEVRSEKDQQSLVENSPDSAVRRLLRILNLIQIRAFDSTQVFALPPMKKNRSAVREDEKHITLLGGQ